MADNNEADALFATRRKRQQEAEAEKERLEELDRQKQQVAEEIKRLENIRALQEEEAKQKAEEQQRLELQRQYAEEQERLAQAKRDEFLNKSMAVKAEKVPGGTNSKKLFLYGGIALGVIVIAVVVIIIISMNSGNSGNKSDSSAENSSTKKSAKNDSRYEDDEEGGESGEYGDYNDDQYGDDGGDAADQDGDGYVSFKEKSSSYSYITASVPGADASLGMTFVYPDFFDAYDGPNGTTIYMCYDEDSEQYIYFRYDVVPLGQDISSVAGNSEETEKINDMLADSFSDEDFKAALVSYAKNAGIADDLDMDEYRVYTLGDFYVEGMTTFEDRAYRDVIPMVLARMKNDYEAMAIFYVSKGDVGCPKFFDDTDVEKLFEIMVDNTDYTRG